MTEQRVIVMSDEEVDDEIRNFYVLGGDDCVVTGCDVEWADGNWLDNTWNDELSQLMGEWEWEDGAWINGMGDKYWELIEMGLKIVMEEDECDGGAGSGDDSDGGDDGDVNDNY